MLFAFWVPTVPMQYTGWSWPFEAKHDF